MRCDNGGTERTDHGFYAVGWRIRRGTWGDNRPRSYRVDRCCGMDHYDGLVLMGCRSFPLIREHNSRALVRVDLRLRRQLRAKALHRTAQGAQLR